MVSKRHAVSRCLAEMAKAPTYEQWRDAAQRHDELTGAAAWQADDACEHYHPELLRADIRDLKRLSPSGAGATPNGAGGMDLDGLVAFLKESLYRSMNDVLEPALYTRAATGPKHLVTRWLDAMESAIEGLVGTPLKDWPADAKLDTVRLAYKNLGRSALLLSGGATLGFYHLGIVRALWKADLLPDVVVGASMGAMIAAGVCSRNAEQLEVLFAPDVPDIETVGLQWRRPGEALRQRTLMRPERLLKTIKANCGTDTFAEAFARSGRVLNISVMPTRTRQKPRVLNHLTAPDVLISSAALASSAVPGLFPPATLVQRSKDGVERPYIEDETWIDGSFGGDLPTSRVSRLHNVNHFIVSQTQPHILPVMAGSNSSGLLKMATEAAVSAARTQGLQALSLARKVVPRGAAGQGVELVQSLVQQEYSGDIDIHPQFDLRAYRKLLTNPSRDDLRWFVREGERATWPKLAQIRDATRISRCLARCQAMLERTTDGK